MTPVAPLNVSDMSCKTHGAGGRRAVLEAVLCSTEKHWKALL